MKHLLLTSTVVLTLAALGSCAGDKDSVFDNTAVSATTGSTDTTGTMNSGTTPVGTGAAPGTSGTVAPTMTTAMPTTTGPMGSGGAMIEPEPDAVPDPVCGDSNTDIVLGEQCDDGNLVDGDGCESDCTLTAVETCGNGMMDPGEECDDGNMTPGDGCENNCTETPEAAVCGNGTQEAGEACDDGNMMDGDGCEADCTNTPPPEPVCGDGMMDPGEECDDGNMVPDDGCEPDCTATPMSLVPTIEELAGDLDGHLIITPCGDTPSSDDCSGAGWSVNGGQLTTCQNNRLEANLTYDIGGQPGTRYDVTMHFYGVMEPRQYGNEVTRDTQGAPSRDEGGTPTPFASAPGGANVYSTGDNNYNTYEIHVDDENGQEVAMYFMNADSGTGHYTLAINYAKTIQLIGGGQVRLRVFDNNCRQIKNCGANGGAPCGGKARTINISGADPQPPAAWLQQPGLGQTADHSGQWWLIDVTGVALAE